MDAGRNAMRMQSRVLQLEAGAKDLKIHWTDLEGPVSPGAGTDDEVTST